jgi:hypothetical protein
MISRWYLTVLAFMQLTLFVSCSNPQEVVSTIKAGKITSIYRVAGELKERITVEEKATKEVERYISGLNKGEWRRNYATYIAKEGILIYFNDSKRSLLLTLENIFYVDDNGDAYINTVNKEGEFALLLKNIDEITNNNPK